jgi:cytochrome oxidase Cu insertion factor (SCO1/SenC/PrrC family)
MAGGAKSSSVVESQAEGVRYSVPSPGSYDLPVIKPAIDGDILDEGGNKRRLFDMTKGRITLLSFIYTRCGDEKGCPLAVSVFYAIEDALIGDPELAGELRMISLSFDPDYDTPEVMAEYATHHVGLCGVKNKPWELATTASQAELQPILDGYGQYVVRERDEDGELTGAFSHVLKVFLIDREKRIRNIYSADFLYPELVLADVRTLLLEERKEALGQ